tara:strand:+ start:24526 stop:30843 length:6318 start_codon:yes stop_codon:yes gene_type:complete
MATRDFRSQQIRTTQIIASGTTGGTTTPSLLIYSASAASNDQGGTNATLLAGVDPDAWLFISGSKRTGDKQNVSFGGNVGISGSLTGSSFTTFPGADLTFDVSDDILLKSSGIEFLQIKNDTQDEVVINDGSADIDFRVESNTKQSAIHVNANQDLVILGRTNAPADLTGASGGVGTDVNVYIDGTKNTKDTGTRGVALVGGDLVVSGTLYAEKQVMEVDLSQTGQLQMSGAIHFKNLGAGSGAAGQAGVNVDVNDGAIFVSTGSLFLRTKTGSIFKENKVGQTYVAGLGLSGTIAGATETFKIRDNVVATLSGSEFTGPLAMTAGQKFFLNSKNGDQFITGDGTTLSIDSDNVLSGSADVSIILQAGADATPNRLNIEDGKTVINNAKQDVDFSVNTSNYYASLFVDSADNTVIIGAQNFDDTPAASELLTKGYTSDVKILLSGSAGSKGISRGVIVAAGDMVISGTLYGATGTQYIKDADEGLKNTAGVAQLDLNSLTTSATIAVSDSIAFIDADGSSATKKGTIANLVTAIAGDGLTNSSNQLQVGVDGSTIERSGDALRVKDAGITAAKIATAVAGDGLTGGGGSALAVNVGPGIKIGTGGNADKTMVDDAVVATLSGSTFTGQVNFNSAITGSTDIHVGASIIHAGDIDTKIDFSTNAVKITTGGVGALLIKENGTNSEVVFNEDGNANMDFRVESNNKMHAIHVASDSDTVLIHSSSYAEGAHVSFFVSGSTGLATQSHGGITVFGGDVVVSGSLVDGNHKKIALDSFVENGTFSTLPIASGADSISVGNDSQATASGAIAVGNKSRASGARSIALGSATGNNTASGISAAALGGEAITASGDYSAVLGGQTNVASGDYSVTMGRSNTVAGDDSVGIGKSLTVPEADTIALGNSSDNAKVVVSGSLKVNSTSTFNNDVTFAGNSDLIVNGYIKHLSDVNTRMQFSTDRIRFATHGIDRLDINSDSQVLVLSGGHSTSANPAAGTDVNFFVSGTIGSKGTATKGTSIFGGDLHVSGALSGPASYNLVDNTIRIFKDGTTMKFVDGVTSAKSLEDLASIAASVDHWIAVHGDNAAASKLKTTASIAFAGDLDGFVDGLANKGVGTDVFFFVSGTLGSKDGAARHTSLFGGDVVVSGSSHFIDVTGSYIKSSGDLIAGGNVIKNSNDDISLKFNNSTSRVLFGALQTGDPQTFVDIRKDDNTVFVSGGDGNDFGNYNLALRNHSTTQNAFAGIAFDVADEEDIDAIGASIVALRDDTSATLHNTNLVLSTNDAADDGLTERMRITHDGKVGIGTNDPGTTLHVVGGDVRFEASAGSINALETHAFFFDKSSGKFGIHNDSPTDKIHIINDSNVAGAAGGNNTVGIDTVNNSYNSAVVLRRAKGTLGSEALATNSTVIGELIFEGHDGTDYEPAAAIKARVSHATSANNDMPGLLSFWTTNDGSTTLQERMHVNHKGQIVVGAAGTWEGSADEKLLSRFDWTAGNTPTPQLGLYNGTNKKFIVNVDPTGDVGITLGHASSYKVLVSGSFHSNNGLSTGGQIDCANIIATGRGVVGGELTVSGSHIHFGNPAESTLQLAHSTGTNTVGNALNINSGQGTGNANGGAIVFNVAGVGSSGAQINPHVLKAKITDAGLLMSSNISMAGNNITSAGAMDIETTSGNLNLKATANNADIAFTVDDAGSDVVALTLDGSNNASAIFTPKDSGYLEVDDADTDGRSRVYGDGYIRLDKYSDGASTGAEIAFFRTRGNSGGTSAVQSGDVLGELTFSGYDTNQVAEAASMVVKASANHGDGSDSTDCPGQFEFYTVPDGSDTKTLALTIGSDQSLTATSDISLGGNLISTGADLAIKSNGNIEFILDDDNNEASQSFSFKNDTTEVLAIDESGNLQADGTVTAITYFPLERMAKISSSDTSGTGDEKLTGKGNTSGIDFTGGYLNKDATDYAYIAPCNGYVDACAVITENRLRSDSGSDIIYIKMYKLAAQSDFDDASPAWTAVGTTMTISEANHASWSGFGSVAGGTQLTKRTGAFTTWGDGDDATYDTSDGSANLRDSWTFSRGDKIIFTIRYDAGNSSNPFYDDVSNGFVTSTTTVNFTWVLGLDWNNY